MSPTQRQHAAPKTTSIEELRELARRAAMDIYAKAAERTHEAAQKDFESKLFAAVEAVLLAREFQKYETKAPESLNDAFVAVYVYKLQELFGEPFKVMCKGREITISW